MSSLIDSVLDAQFPTTHTTTPAKVEPPPQVKRVVSQFSDIDPTTTVFVKYEGKALQTFKVPQGMATLSDRQTHTLGLVLKSQAGAVGRPVVWQMGTLPAPAPVAPSAPTQVVARGPNAGQPSMASGVCLLCRALGMGHAVDPSELHTCAKLKGQASAAAPGGITGTRSHGRITVEASETDADVQAQADALMATPSERRAGLDDWASPGMDDTARTRVLGQETAARAAGFALQETLYERGMLVNAVGVRNARAKRLAWEKKDTVHVGMGKLQMIIADEKRDDVEVDMSAVSMDADGWVVANGSRYAIERAAMPQMFQRYASTMGVGSPGAAMADWTSPRLVDARVATFNAFAAQVGEDHAAAGRKFLKMTPAERRELRVRQPQKPRMVLRTRLDNGADGSRIRGVFAAVSPKYTAMDADVLAQACKDMAGAHDFRCDVIYEGRRCKIDIIAHSDQAEGAACGEIYEYFIRLETSDTGQGGIKVSAGLLRNRCLNYYVIDTSVLKFASLRHMGDVADLQAAVEGALAKARDAGKDIFAAWDKGCDKVLLGNKVGPSPVGAANKQRAQVAAASLRADKDSDTLLADLLDKHARSKQADAIRDEILAGMFRGLILADLLPIGARSIDTSNPDDDVILKLIAAHDHQANAGQATERGISLASLASAATYFAHEMQDDPWTEVELERAGGALLTLKGQVPWSARPQAAQA